MTDEQIDEALDRILERAHTYELHRHPSVKNLDGLSNDIASVRQALERQRVPEERAPWHDLLLSEWSIVGMNHYHINGERFLFVALCKDGYCIKEEGRDDKYLWNRLWHKANASPAAPEPDDQTQ